MHFPLILSLSKNFRLLPPTLIQTGFTNKNDELTLKRSC